MKVSDVGFKYFTVLAVAYSGLSDLTSSFSEKKSNIPRVCTFYIKVSQNNKPLFFKARDKLNNESTLCHGTVSIKNDSTAHEQSEVRSLTHFYGDLMNTMSKLYLDQE